MNTRNGLGSLLLLFSLTFLAVQPTVVCISSADYLSEYRTSARDYWPTEGWRNSTPEEQGLDSSKLNEMIDHIDQENLAVNFLVIIKDGYLVFEKYFHSLFSASKKVDLFSITKSITATTLGIAIDDGYIDNVDQTVLDYFPEKTIENNSTWKQDMSLEHLLTMTSGLEWDEWSTSYGHSNNSWTQMTSSSDWIEFILGREMVAEPGTKWSFSTGDPHVLSAVITKATETTTFDYASENLFDPLGIDDISWFIDGHGITNGGNGIRMNPHDIAKYGYLYLNNGTWDGEQIVSEDWICQSLSPKASIPDEYDYGYDSCFGYNWFSHNATGVYSSHRLIGGRNLFIVPEHDLLVVMSCTTLGDTYPQGEVLYDYVLASVTDSNPGTSLNLETFVPWIIVFGIICPVLFVIVYKIVKAKSS